MKNKNTIVAAPAVESVRVGLHEYEIEINGELTEAMGCWGCVKPSELTMKFNHIPQASRFAEVLMHEVIHALHAESNIDISTDFEENLTTLMGAQSCLFIKNNPQFMETIFALLGIPIRFLDKKEAKEYYANLVSQTEAPSGKKQEVLTFKRK